jgi:hypothetical protein
MRPRDAKSNRARALRAVPAVERSTPWIGSPDNRVAVRVAPDGKIEISGEINVPPHTTQSVIIDYLPGFDQRIREVLRGRPLLRVADVSTRLNVAESWVRRHAQALGAVGLGDGRGNDLRFRPDVVEAFIAKRAVK